MIVGSLNGGGPDGTLVVISPDRARFALPERGPRTLQHALEDWDHYEPGLRETFEMLLSPDHGVPVDQALFASPLPRAFHWAEGSCYLPHMERIRGSRGEPLPLDHRSRPKVYQSGSDQNFAPVSDFALQDVSWELDVEATIVVFTGSIPAGASAKDASEHIRFVGLTNDLTHRRQIVEERQEGSGIYHSKPGRPYAPYVVTPDTLGDLWAGTVLRARVETRINDELLGQPWADRDLAFDFGRILTHLARTRPLTPGSIVGTGTVSNTDPENGLGCLAEKRALEIADTGKATTGYLHSGDSITIEAFADDGTSLFGRIAQNVVAAA